jgi:hypothetical protein
MRAYLLCCACLCAISANGLAQTPPAFVQPEDFTILPWSWMPADAKLLASVRECGFNVAGFVGPGDLDAVKAAGLKAIVSDASLHVSDDKLNQDESTIRKNVAALVERVGKHPALFGYYLRDEPNARMFPTLGRYVAAYREADPNARCYINLFPNYASPDQLGTSTYDAYLERFITTAKPPFVSYDHYALMEGNLLRAGYFPNLEAVRKAALAHKLPFWNIVLGNSHFNYAEPTEAGLRFQAYTTVAYGGRGLSYFTYLTPAHGNYRLAAIDQFGNKTPTWDMIRRVNLQLHVLAPTLVKLTSVNVFHHPDVPEGCQGIGGSRFVTELSGGSLLVGEFEDADKQPYVMVVNKSLQSSTPVSVKFRRPGEVMYVNSYTGQRGNWSGEALWLAPGQGMLLVLPK